MIWHQILSIVSYWQTLYTSADISKRETLKSRVEVVRSSQRVGMLRNYDLYAYAGEHYQEINKNGFYCSCTAFAVSSTEQNTKRPCKHLYAFASGILINY